MFMYVLLYTVPEWRGRSLSFVEKSKACLYLYVYRHAFDFSVFCECIWYDYTVCVSDCVCHKNALNDMKTVSVCQIGNGISFL